MFSVWSSWMAMYEVLGETTLGVVAAVRSRRSTDLPPSLPQIGVSPSTIRHRLPWGEKRTPVSVVVSHPRSRWKPPPPPRARETYLRFVRAWNGNPFFSFLMEKYTQKHKNTTRSRQFFFYVCGVFANICLFNVCDVLTTHGTAAY